MILLQHLAMRDGAGRDQQRVALGYGAVPVDDDLQGLISYVTVADA
ncbi:MAG TPA: hypothetical protein VGT98_04715 [Candidatus Elarobacter sp.]|nr:hypothetical protein [Candidatus Elarobacter sp.]